MSTKKIIKTIDFKYSLMQYDKDASIVKGLR